MNNFDANYFDALLASAPAMTTDDTPPQPTPRPAMFSLSQPQQRIVAHRKGAALIVAGPGSGKTAVLTRRAAALIDDGVAPYSILLMTFTNKASREMSRRCYALIGEAAKGIHIGTFHVIALRLLWQHGLKFSLFGGGEQHDAVNQIRKEYGLTKSDPSAGDFLQLFGRASSADEPLDAYAVKAGIDITVAQNILTAYREMKTEYGAYDYDDLLVMLRDTLRDNLNFRERMQNKFRYLMIDEYQDTNPIQAHIVRLLADSDENVMAVGDDSQSIYAFRGANVGNILRFFDDYKTAVRYDLIENHRSKSPIVDAANRLMSHATEKIDKVLTSTRGAGEPVRVVTCRDESVEAENVVKQIQVWQSNGIALHNIAVLYRSSFHAMRVEMALTAAKIPFVKRGGRKITESKHIRDLIACLWILVNPQQRMAWQRVLILIDGIGAKTAATAAGVICASDDPVIALKSIHVPKKSQETCRALWQWYQEAQRATNAAESMYEAWSWYDQFFMVEFKDEMFREQGLHAIHEFASEYATAKEFLNEFVLDEDPLTAEGEVKDKLVLSTIHSAKGLEFDAVAMIHLNDGCLPSYRAETYEEERRLCYVALTRAKSEAVIFVPKRLWKGDREEAGQESAFVEEMRR